MNIDYKDAKEYIKSFFSKRSFSGLSGKLIIDNKGEIIPISHETTGSNTFLVIQNSQGKGVKFDRETGVLTIKKQKLKNAVFDSEHFDAFGFRNFLYEKNNVFYPVNFVFEENEIYDFDAETLNNTKKEKPRSYYDQKNEIWFYFRSYDEQQRVQGEIGAGRHIERNDDNTAKKDKNGKYIVLSEFNEYLKSHHESEARCEFIKNTITGTLSNLSKETPKHKEFLENNELGKEIGFSGCIFDNFIIENRTITVLKNINAKKKIVFKNCKILKTDFYFGESNLVQFLGKNSIEKIEDIYGINDSRLGDGSKVGDIYISNDTNIIGKICTPEEKQYFFKQMKRFQEKRGDHLQVLIAHKKYLEQELKLKNIGFFDKIIIWASKLLGGGVDYVKPLLVLIIAFTFVSGIKTILLFDINLLTETGIKTLLFNVPSTLNSSLPLLFPTLPHIMFDKFGTDFPMQVIFIYYIVLVVSWYFIIKSLHKFTYRK